MSKNKLRTLFDNSLGIAIGPIFSKILCSSRSSRPENIDKKTLSNNFTGKQLCWSLFFDKAWGGRPETLLKRDLSAGPFLCIFRNTFWYELVDILLLLVDIFFMLLLLLVLPYKFLIKSLLIHWVDEKLFSRCRLQFFRMIVYVLLKFDWLIIFFLENPPWKFFSQLFFSLVVFSAVFQISRLRMLTSKIRRNFLPVQKL